MCNICFPTCGRCKPVSIVLFTCLNCGRADNVTRDEYLMYANLPHKLSEAEAEMHEANAGAPLLCKECGTNLLETLQRKIVPAMCKRSQIQCGFPCGRHTQDPEPSNPCTTMVPIGPYLPDADLRQ